MTNDNKWIWIVETCYVIALHPDLLYSIFWILNLFAFTQRALSAGHFAAVAILARNLLQIAGVCTCLNLHIITFVSFFMREAWRRQALRFWLWWQTFFSFIFLFGTWWSDVKWRYLCLDISLACIFRVSQLGFSFVSSPVSSLIWNRAVAWYSYLFMSLFISE